jgi:glycosyltransferase involved in cell wall biosynthesis
MVVIKRNFDLTWPFTLVHAADGADTGWALINGPIMSFAQQEEFARLRRAGYRFAGMSSYMTFPKLDDGDPLDYQALCEAWCHCFREPHRFLNGQIPRALISASDFTDHRRIAPQVVTPVDPADRVDFVYAGAMEDWKRVAKNWGLAGRCIPRICREVGLRALVIGEPTEGFPPAPGVVFSPPLHWHSLLARLAGARFLFVPSALDASPRLLAEALCLDIPLVVYRQILGGWKYVNRFTGGFFDDEHNVVAAVRACLDQAVAPREWFRANHGCYVAAQRLLRLLRTVDAGFNRHAHLWLAEESAASVEALSH